MGVALGYIRGSIKEHTIEKNMENQFGNWDDVVVSLVEF